MADKNNNKKILKHKQKVHEYLLKYKNNEDNKDKATHRAWGIFNGNFLLEKDQQKEFIKLYAEAIEYGVNDFTILETPKEYAPLVVDIDLELPSESYTEGRLYDESMVLNIIKKYIKSLNTFLDVDDIDYRICYLEKKAPTEKNGVYKDGFHIMFQELVVNKKLRHLIRHNVVKLCEEDNIFSE